MLTGLCDNVPAEDFYDHERVYFLKTVNTTAPIIVKACKSLQHPNTPWYATDFVIYAVLHFYVRYHNHENVACGEFISSGS